MAAGQVPAAVRAGDLLFLSGLMAAGRGGATVAAQMREILTTADRICAAAGTSLANVVRIQQFHLDLAALRAARQVWEDALPGRYLPLSAVCVPAPLPAPGAAVLVDLWVYAPPKG
jgi:enamine deaminase RidA (YjgF/YER057c/UK114 family)